MWSLLLALILHYNVLLGSTIPNFFGVKKFRVKKLGDFIFNNDFLNLRLKDCNIYSNF